ncbi:TetR family transcriptional regulator [Aliiruegeria haliotis]|uniref:TetR family transcriptional regulator n=1 Tax=Aliiruegeria haliotis TaxID=1280846 RepID=A0A2T0RST5_9RHOB|nr:TetR/AcrR family transcriptional regulator [Aliiruegeria haliotis]PRY24170.1 TetR family transcriptional regulator [Aliiruegeria haliotis]
MNAVAGRIKRGRKYDQVVEGARNVFLQDGFEGASVDDIAKSAGVSKATLYSYFPDKRLLFMEVASGECRRSADGACCEIDEQLRPREALTQIGRKMVEFYLSGFGQAVFRIVVAESGRFPELGREFWNNGPAQSRALLARYFRAATKRGELAIDDFDLAADQFSELCKVDLFPRMILGLEDSFSEEDRARVIAGAVEMFVARYGA